jgi:hypothetical protein
VRDALTGDWNISGRRAADLLVVLPRVDTSPPLGRNRDALLAIGLPPESGWSFTFYDPHFDGLNRGREVYAPFDAAGAADVAEIAVRVNCDPANPFPHR